MGEEYKNELIKRLAKDLLDVQLLRLVQTQPMWGYLLKKKAETQFHIKLRHGLLYPTLNSLERKGFVVSQKQPQNGRARKIYTITEEGKRYIQDYYEVIRDQLRNKDLK
jgi:PadR family transcriptional regulator PadR